ncbi:MAG: tetratricopeptide repeat protein [Calditrichaceae bacterium]
MKIISKMKNQINKLVLSILSISLVTISTGFSQVRNDKAIADSLFKNLSIDDLIQIKKYYDSKVQEARDEEESYRVKGLSISEDFLSEQGMKIKDRDRVYIRLAEYYIEEAERNYNTEVDLYDKKYDEYEKQYALYDEGELEEEPTMPEFPKYDYSKPIEIYDRILTEYPAGDFADDALYSKAWLLDKMNQGADSRRIYQEVIDKYPDSHFAPESYIQLAEYFFNPRDDKTDEEEISVEIQKAIQLYKKVLRYKDSKRYDEALYKLGWSYYKLAAREPHYYDDAITYFMMVADDITKAQELDPAAEISNPNVKEEAITYVGISFTDEAYTTSGVDKARRMLERIGDRPYGAEVMRAIGQTYQKIDEQEKAIYAYQNLLDMYPDYREGPIIQQNVVDALFALGRDQEAYIARHALYENYGPESGWYLRMEESDLDNKLVYLNAAYKYSEQALRTNIILDLEHAEEVSSAGTTDIPAYEKVIDGSLLYLNSFPTDSNAYEIHWSYAFLLDSRLGRFEDAFNEYIKVSNDYYEDHHQHQAALNAVVVADTLVKIRYGDLTDSTNTFDLSDLAELSPRSLTPEETRLVEAYDNYIRLFPLGEYTPKFLAAAGGIYYNHYKFAEAKVYFQTLVKRFPNAEQMNLALRSIMDSYFALGKFKDSEVVAKRIMNTPNISEEQRSFASKRLGQAIFKNAEFLEEQGDFFSAGSEFFRVYQEARFDERLVERAVYNSGLNYAKAKDWVRSIQSYDTLATYYPKSQYAIPSLENMAENYVELEQYSNAASTYERVFSNYRETDNAETALYNASFYYNKGENWQKAIDANQKYIAAYPDKTYATDLYFKNAGLYLKLDNVTEANRIYEEFAQKYPDDPRAVEAYYERGKYYLDNGMSDRAKSEFNSAIAKSETFRREGKDPNAFIAGEAVSELAGILHKDYMAIELKQPASNIETKKKELSSTLKELNQTYTKVLSFGSPRSFEATYNIARSYEEYAQKFSDQEMNPNLDQNKRFVERQKINEQSAALYEKAFEEYKNVVDNIPVVAERLGVDMFAEVEETPDSILAIQDSLQLSRVAEKDSTKELAVKWYEKAKDKVSEMLYTEASLTTENVEQAVNIAPVGNSRLQRLSYKLQVLMKVAAPAINKTIDAHIRNINEAEQSNLSNKFVEESKRQILLTKNILGNELEALAHDALNNYSDIASNDLPELVEKGYEATNSEGLNYYGLDEDANQMIDYAREISKTAIDSYSSTLNMAKEFNIKSDLIRNTQDRLLRFAVEIGDDMKVLGDSAIARSDFYRVRFDSTENYDYDEASIIYQNHTYNFQDSRRIVMELAFDIKNENDIKNLWANKLLLRLIKLDPERYTESIEKERVEVVSDGTWLFSTTYTPEVWTMSDFDDSGWQNAGVVFNSTNPYASLNLYPDAIWTVHQMVSDSTLDSLGINSPIIETPEENEIIENADSSMAFADTVMIDSTGGSIIAETGPADADSIVFFRKKFAIDGTPTNGLFIVTADDDYRLYLNGDYIIDDAENTFTKLDSIDYITLEYSLKKGENIIAIDVEDKDLTAQGLMFYSYFEVIPADITEAAERQARAERVVVDPQLLERVNVLNKNRITTNR